MFVLIAIVGRSRMCCCSAAPSALTPDCKHYTFSSVLCDAAPCMQIPSLTFISETSAVKPHAHTAIVSRPEPHVLLFRRPLGTDSSF